MKIGQLRSENDRVVALVLLVCISIIMAGCMMGVFYLREYNFYGDEKGETAKSVAVQLYSADDVSFAEDYYLCRETDSNHSEEIREYKSDYYATRFSTENTNFVFAIYDIDGELLFDSANPEREEFASMTFETAKIDPEYRGQSDFFFFDENSIPKTLRLEYGIIASESQTVNDRYSSAFEWIDMAYSLRYFVFVVLFASVAVIVWLLMMFAVNAGTVDKETGEILPGFIDKLPFDFVTVLTALLVLMANVVYGLTEAADAGMVLKNVVVVIIVVVAVLVAMTYVTTVSVRFKLFLREDKEKANREKP